MADDLGRSSHARNVQVYQKNTANNHGMVVLVSRDTVKPTGMSSCGGLRCLFQGFIAMDVRDFWHGVFVLEEQSCKSCSPGHW